MSEFDPSFCALYAQARPSLAPGKSMEQRERFATACLAFVLRHDPEFRGDFLRVVCGHKAFDATKFQISLEIPNCGDLALRADDVQFIIEAKVDAPLEDKQNPAKPLFYKSGYGHGIRQASHLKSTYVVLWQKDASPGDMHKRELPCLFRHWNDLKKIDARGKSIVDDLFDSLGSFGIRCFAIGNPMTDNLNLASRSNDACKVHDVLRNVADYLENLGLPNTKDNSIFDSAGGSYIGWDLTRQSWDSAHKKKAGQKWIDYINSKPGEDYDEISWFGYGDEKLNVGFYCEPKRVKAVHSALKRCAAAGYGEVHLDTTYVWIASKDGGPAAGDKEWFRKIYDDVNNEIDRHRSTRPAPAASPRGSRRRAKPVRAK